MKTMAWKVAMFWMAATHERILHAKFVTSALEERWRLVVKGYIRAANIIGNNKDAEMLMGMLERQDLTDEYLSYVKEELDEPKAIERAEIEAIMVSISTAEALKGRFYKLVGWDKEIDEKSVGIPGW